MFRWLFKESRCLCNSSPIPLRRCCVWRRLRTGAKRDEIALCWAYFVDAFCSPDCLMPSDTLHLVRLLRHLTTEEMNQRCRSGPLRLPHWCYWCSCVWWSACWGRTASESFGCWIKAVLTSLHFPAFNLKYVLPVSIVKALFCVRSRGFACPAVARSCVADKGSAKG